MALPSRRARTDDAELARRLAAGEHEAFSALDARYRRPLIRYARSLLRRSEHDAEDVVQDVLVRAHGLLAAGEGPDELRPWLYRLVRNRAIDEVRRARWGDSHLDEGVAVPAGAPEDPEAAVRRREAVHRLVEELAGLPERQRAALLAHDVDGEPWEDVAARMDISVPAAQMLASRARGALTDPGALSALALPPAGFAPAALLAKLLGTGKTAAAGAALAVAATGGVAVLATDRHDAGEPAPFQVRGIRGLVGHPVTRGDAVPRDTAIVTARVHVPAEPPEAGERRTVTLPCPRGMRVAGLQAPEQRLPVSYGLAKGTVIGASTRAVVVFGRRALPRAYEATVGIACRRPGPTGSIVSDPRPLRAGESRGRVCASSAHLYREPGRIFVGTVFLTEPVAVQRRTANGRWVRVATDLRSTGWVAAAALCRRP